MKATHQRRPPSIPPSGQLGARRRDAPGLRPDDGLVLNHCSASHPWFEQYLSSTIASPAADTADRRRPVSPVARARSTARATAAAPSLRDRRRPPPRLDDLLPGPRRPRLAGNPTSASSSSRSSSTPSRAARAWSGSTPSPTRGRSRARVACDSQRRIELLRLFQELLWQRGPGRGAPPVDHECHAGGELRLLRCGRPRSPGDLI